MIVLEKRCIILLEIFFLLEYLVYITTKKFNDTGRK